MTLSEGGNASYIEIVLTLPPRFICASSDELASANGTCEINIYGLLETDSTDQSCSDGARIPQAVIGWPRLYGDDIVVPCGVKVVETNWFWVLRLAIKAKVDLVKDVTYTRDLSVFLKISVGVTVVRTSISVIEVCVFSCSFFYI